VKITAISNIQFDNGLYQKFVHDIDAYPVVVSHRPWIDETGRKILDKQGNEQPQTLLEFSVDREKARRLIPALQAQGADVWVDGQKSGVLPTPTLQFCRPPLSQIDKIV